MNQNQQVDSLRRSFRRLTRFFSLCMREQLTRSPITMQQLHTLEALMSGPKSMNGLAAEVALHQSTLTRIVDRLEKQKLIRRGRKAGNQRSVEISLTDPGRALFAYWDAENAKLVAGILALVPAEKREALVESTNLLAGLFSMENPAFVALLENCCAEKCCSGGNE